MIDKISMILRVLLGLILALAGANKFFGFMPMPEMSEAGGALMGAIAASGYMLPLIAVVEIAGGLLLILNKCQTFALVLLAPVIVNILLFHLFLDTAGLPIAVVMAGIMGFLGWQKKDYISNCCK